MPPSPGVSPPKRTRAPASPRLGLFFLRASGSNHSAAGAYSWMSEKPKFHSKMIKDGRWTVAVSTGYGPESHVGNFATEEEANRWIATESKNWPQTADKPK